MVRCAPASCPLRRHQSLREATWTSRDLLPSGRGVGSERAVVTGWRRYGHLASTGAPLSSTSVPPSRCGRQANSLRASLSTGETCKNPCRMPLSSPRAHGPSARGERSGIRLHFAPPPLTCENAAKKSLGTGVCVVDGGGKVEYGGAPRKAVGTPTGRRRGGGGPVFLGTHTPRLDEKGRLFLPAKYRDAWRGAWS